MGTFEEILQKPAFVDVAERWNREQAKKNALTYDQVRNFQHTGSDNTDTDAMRPNIVAPDKVNPAVTGVVPGGKGGVNNATDGTDDATAAGETAPKIDSYDKMLAYLDAQNRSEADAQKRQKNRELMSSLGDAVSALSSLYNAHKGGPVTYKYGDDMTAVARERHDRAMQERNDLNSRYLAYLKVQQAKEAAEEGSEYKRLLADYRQQQLDEQKRNNAERNQIAREREQRLKQVAADRNMSQIGKAVYPTRYNYYRVTAGYDDETAHQLAMQDAADALEASQKQDQQRADAATARAGKGRSAGAATTTTTTTRSSGGTTKKGKGNTGKTRTGGSGTKYTNTKALNY